MFAELMFELLVFGSQILFYIILFFVIFWRILRKYMEKPSFVCNILSQRFILL